MAGEILRGLVVAIALPVSSSFHTEQRNVGSRDQHLRFYSKPVNPNWQMLLRNIAVFSGK